jgi:uncharacterized membrane protein YdjX (TVP38/TMEM64 family)
MRTLGKEEARHLALAVAILGALVLALSVLALTGHLQPIVRRSWQIFESRDHLRTYVESWGALAPAAFILIQAMQVVVAPIPGELTGAVGGFLFGTLPNVLYSTIGLTIGSVVAFLAARIVGLPLVKLVVSDQFLEKFHFLTERRGALLTLVLFSIPGFPKDMLCYLLGISPMGFWMFVVLCTVGRIPGTVMLSMCGCAVYDKDWTLLASVTITALLLLLVSFLYRDRIQHWIRKTGRESL